MRALFRPTRPGAGFTLVELLVVIVIIGLISATALPVVLPALNERRVSEGARVVQSVLAGARDAAVRANGPRGIRLLPDPRFNFAANAAAGQPLASNRFVAIEPAPPYSEGLVNGVTVVGSSTASIPLNPYTSDTGAKAQYIRVEASELSSGTPPIPQDPTGWQFNIRQGDKIRFNDSGAYYTVAGPIHRNIDPTNALQSITSNPERYICYQPFNIENYPFFEPTSQLYTANGIALPVEYLNLTNGVDDDNDGWVDESCDGIDNDGDGITDPGFNGIDDNNNGIIDDPAELLIGKNAAGANSLTGGSEYEVEQFLGVYSTPGSLLNASYEILRQPVVSPNAIETTLPEGVVIDLTTWNAPAAKTSAGVPAPSLPERSRLPVNPFSGYVDIMIDQSGRVLPPGAGSGGSSYTANSPLASLPFYHFWLAERDDVVTPLFIDPNNYQYASGLGSPIVVPTSNPNYGATTSPQNYLLPMPKGTVDVNGVAYAGPIYLKSQRRLVTLFAKTGQIVSNSIETFNLNDTSAPYYDAQNGTKEAQ